ncbi:glycogen debranching protein GlgX [Piscinibacter sakaiensis]|uniref:Glycogen debranching enzyme n=1 Tax=Piscinibacter sakaiensis TaxID=1547922 RepID=A0A0K8NYU0_PISS1|nr:glycogen debranching protein GlgX [Piscinibacter sakaiensis]GAP35546.1 glycogen debranching enzyme [Piscinibacter sakaiensis]
MSADGGAAIPRLSPGRPWPLGAHWDGRGVNVAVFSAHATGIELCLFDAQGEHELARLPLPAHTQDVWHGRLEGAGPGLVYGLRARGPWRPDRGHWFNPNKLLLDPCARELVGRFAWDDAHFAADRRHPQHMDPQDNAALALKARVVDERPGAYDWGEDAPPATPLAQTVFYELNLKAFSALNPALPPALRGTYAGLAHPASIAHLRRLGVTAVELLPVHHHVDEERLVKMGLVNHWGYNTLGFFAPDPRFASGAGGRSPRDEFRDMVRALHAAGLEVILDVVYNHTAEGDERGPALSFRGLDNASYYRLYHDAEHRLHHENHTGCGNTLDIRQPRVLQLVMDSLRFWVEQMHVDGFRFDLAPVLGRGDHGFDRHAAFFTAVAQDPVLSRVKMIAEPWDVGPGGYQVGGFPRGWLEWNDHFRDAMRGYWLHMGHGGGPTRGDFAQRLCGSSDLYERRARSPSESVNYVVSHDGFSLRDLVSYAERRNHANGENNRDGHGHNLSFNCGAEGPSDDPAVLALRGRLQRALLATALLAQGTPLLAAGDELGHGQQGNNNPYCQDNPITWIDWAAADSALIDFTARAIALRRRLLPLGDRWYSGLPDRRGLPDIAWLRSDGQSLEGEAWRDPASHVLGCLIGRPGRCESPLLLLVNADTAARRFRLPAGPWTLLLDSTTPDGRAHEPVDGAAEVMLPAHALWLLGSAEAAAALG